MSKDERRMGGEGRGSMSREVEDGKREQWS